MTRDQFILKRLKDNSNLYAALFWVFAATVFGAAALVIPAWVKVGLAPAVTMAFLALSMGGMMLGMKRMHDDATLGVVEYQAYMDDPEHDELKLSETTRRALRELHSSPNELMQMWIAYGVLTFVLFGGGAVICGVAGSELVLYLGGALLFLMGIGIAILAVQSFLAWRVARKLED